MYYIIIKLLHIETNYFSLCTSFPITYIFHYVQNYINYNVIQHFHYRHLTIYYMVFFLQITQFFSPFLKFNCIQKYNFQSILNALFISNTCI